jgi:hypothetical protein
MGILEHEDRPVSRLQLAHQAGDDLVGHRTARHELLQLAARFLGDAVQRPERPRGEERVACSAEDPSGSADLLAEAADERRLPHSRFAAHEDEPAARAPLDLAQPLVEKRKVVRALEQRLGRERCAQVETACERTLST